MRAMVLHTPKQPLILEDLPIPVPQENELLIRVSACGVCRTDLHIQDGDLPHPHLPLILGHEIVGTVESMGKNVKGFRKGERVGVPWLGGTCGTCSYCYSQKENLCEKGEYTGYTLNGGFAEFTTCKADVAIHFSQELSDVHVAPLLCAGLIGYRAYKKAAPEKTLGIYGFGAAAHLITQNAISEGKEVYAFTRPGDIKTQEFARKLGAVWAGDSTVVPPTLLDASIIFAPVGSLVPPSLKALKKGGRCICGGIYMSDIPTFPYSDLWGEKSIASVANITRQDAKEFFEMVAKVPFQTEVKIYSLEKVQEALTDLKQGKFQGAAVIQMQQSVKGNSYPA